MQQVRTIMAVVLSMAVIFIYYTWIAPPAPPSPSISPSTQTSPAPSQEELSPSPAQKETLPKVKSLPLETRKVQEITIENSSTRTILSTLGGMLKEWVLKHFHQEASEESPLTDLLGNGAPGEGLLVTLGKPSVDEALYFSVEAEKSEEGNQSILLSGNFNGLIVTKYLEINEEENPYLVNVRVEVTNTANEAFELSPRIWIKREQKELPEKKGFLSFLKPPPDFWSPSLYLNGSMEADTKWHKLPQKVEKTGKVYWAALTDRYFIMSLISRQESDNISVQYGRLEGNKIYTSLSYGAVSLKPGEKIERRFSAYLGPKKREILASLGVHLEKSVDYGWFGFVAIPLLWLLIFFHKLVGNWGLAIILLTFFVKLLLHPINKKSMQSMKAMQKIQPELQKIREKFKDSKEKLNMEMMMLFKRHKVNPMGGCLPLLLQMPIYIALYKVLYNSIELYHAPFVWFYKDLSAPDPYLISPILLGIFMALQQKLTPTTTVDPAQQKMMMIMPLMFSAFMIFLPSGLVIYIFVNTVMSVIQQYMIHKEISSWDILKKIFPKKA